MKQLSQADAQQLVDNILAFQKELKILENQQIIHLLPEQKESINNYQQQLLQELKKHNDIDINMTSKQLTLTSKILTFFGAIAFSLSLGFFINFFSVNLDPAIQTSLLIFVSISSLALTYYLDKYGVNDYLVELTSFISVSYFIINTSIILDINEIIFSWSLLLAWAIYSFLLAYFSHSRLILIVALSCLSIYIAYLIGYLSPYPFEGINTIEHYLVMSFCWVIPFIFHHRQNPQFDVVYRIFGLLFVFMMILVLAMSGDSHYLAWEQESIKNFYLWLGLVCTTVFIYLGIRFRFKETMNIASCFFTIFLYLKIYNWCWDYLPTYLFFLIIALTSLLLLLIFKRIRFKLNQGENDETI